MAKPKLKDTYNLADFGLVSPKYLLEKIKWNGSETPEMMEMQAILKSGRNQFTLGEIANFAEIVYPSWMVATQDFAEDHEPLEVHNANQAEARRERILEAVAEVENRLNNPDKITDREDALYMGRKLAEEYRALKATGKPYEMPLRALNYLVVEFKLTGEEIYIDGPTLRERVEIARTRLADTRAKILGER